MKVSIIIPVYNVEKYIVRCLNSVINQTWQDDIECILVDDCSTDNSVNMIKEYIKNYHGSVDFKFLHHSKNKGQSSARNTGLKVAKGDYVFFLDSDDAIAIDCMDVLTALAKRYPKADFVQGNLLDNNFLKSHYAFNESIPEYCDTKDELESLMLSKIITSACNRLIKHYIIIQNQLYFPVGIFHEDMHWIYFLSRHTHAAAFTTHGTYIYYTNESSTMTSTSPRMHIRRYQSRLVSSTAYINDLKENSGSTYRRMYIGVNLLSCLTELVPLHSIKHWMYFWRYVCKEAFNARKHFTCYRMIYMFLLLPPFCFFAGKDKVRWRLQQSVLIKI